MLVITDLIGKPFKDGGRGPNEYDCWGLAKEVYRRAGIDLPDYTICCEDASSIDSAIDGNRTKWIKVEGEPPIPSMVVMRFGSEFCNHTGVYIGNGQFVHTRTKTGVNIERIDSINWRRRIEGIYIPGWVTNANHNSTEKSI